MNAIVPPVMTTNIALQTPVSDEVLVNRDGSTAVQTTNDLAAQLAATSPLDLGGFQAPLFATEAALKAATLTDKVSAWVFDDSDAERNGVWSWTGASWVWTLPLPYSISILENLGAGTANAIAATSRVPLVTGLIVVLPITATTTLSPVTVTVNGRRTFVIKTLTGDDVVPGGLTENMLLLALVSGEEIRLISDQASAAIIELAQAAAEAAMASANAGFVFNSVSAFGAANIPGILPFVRTAGYTNPGDGGAATYVRLDAAPDPVRLWHKQSADGSWWMISEPVIYPQMLGVKADGNSDSTTAIGAVFDLAELIGAKVYFGAGRYRQDTAIAKAYSIDVELHDEAIIDCREMANGTTAWSFSGSYGTAYPLTATGAFKAKNISVSITDAANFSANDYVIIRSDNVFDPHRTSSKCGEINRVSSVNPASGVITLAVPLQSTYSTNPVVERPSWIRGLCVRGGSFLGEDGTENLNSAKAAINVSLAFDVSIENVIFTRMDNRAVTFTDSFDAIFTRNNVRRAFSSGTAYAVSFLGATQDCTASENYFEEVRHCLSTNNHASRGGLVRRVTFANNHMFCSAQAVAPGTGGGDAIDTHTGADGIKIIGNTVIGSAGQGINSECLSVEVVHNTILDSASNGIAVHNEAGTAIREENDRKGTAIILGNVVQRSGSRGIYLFNGSAGTGAFYEGAIIADNVVEDTVGPGIQVNAATSSAMLGLKINGNTVLRPGGRALDAYKIEDSVVSNNTLDGVSGAVTLNLRDSKGVAITGNVGTQPGASTTNICALTASAAGAGAFCEISGNRFGGKSGASITGSGVLLDNNIQYTGVHANNVRGSNGVLIGTGAGNAQANNIT